MNSIEKILAAPDESHAEFLTNATDAEVNDLVDALSDAANDPDVDQSRRSEVIALALSEQSRRLCK